MNTPSSLNLTGFRAPLCPSEKTSTTTNEYHTLTCTVKAPTRIDLAGGTLDIWPLVPILQEKKDLWYKPISTVNMAIGLSATATVTLKGTELRNPNNRDNENNPITKDNANNRDTEGNQHDLNINWVFEDLTITGGEKAKASGRSLSGNYGEYFPLSRGIARHYLPSLKKAGVNEIQITTNAQAPKGSGLGGSSSVVVAILTALEHLLGFTTPKATLCEIAKNIEAGILGGLAGNQDHFAAAIGGVQAVRHGVFGSTSQVIKCNGNELMDHIVLAHSRQQHFSAFSNWLILEKVLTGDAEILQKFSDIAAISDEIIPYLQESQWNKLANAISREWQIRRTLAAGVTTEILDGLYKEAINAGAMGGKVCGAGGGGVLVMFLPEPAARAKVAQAITQAGGEVLCTQFSETGAAFY